MLKYLYHQACQGCSKSLSLGISAQASSSKLLVEVSELLLVQRS